jgi:three-Cys-motif partner protein
MRRRRPPHEELTYVRAEPDDRPARVAGPWARDKLCIISNYCRQFTTACQSARGGIYADPFCGPGLNHVEGTDEYLWGSGMLAARTEPPFERLYMMDLDAASFEAMRDRVDGDQRVTLQRGNANRDFVPMLQPALQSPAPIFCVLDPHGIELRWATIATLGQPRARANRPELLILLSDRMGYMRLLPTSGVPSDRTLHEMTAFFGNGGWREVHESKQREEISPTEAREAYAQLYERGLSSLGYPDKGILRRDVRRHGDRGGSLYQLIFATEHEAGVRIMDYIFETMRPQNPQGRLF